MLTLTRTHPVYVREPPHLLETLPTRRIKYLKPCLQSCFPSSSSFDLAHAAMAVTAPPPTAGGQIFQSAVSTIIFFESSHVNKSGNCASNKKYFWGGFALKKRPSVNFIHRLLTFSQTPPPPPPPLLSVCSSLSPP